MPSQKFRVGITRDALRDDGKTVFDAAALKVLDDPLIEWEFIPENVKEVALCFCQINVIDNIDHALG